MRKFVFFALVLFFDFCTKYWVSHHLPLIQPFIGYPFGGIGILNAAFLKVSIVHTTNTGTAWGFFPNYLNFLLFFRIAIAGGLLAYLFFFHPPKYLQMPLTLIAAGAFGNILDVFLYGHVIDMIYCIFYRYSYPIFNIADSAIFCSVLYLFFFSSRKRTRRHVSAN